jgi:integrase
MKRTQKDNMAELKQLRSTFDEAPIDSITPFIIAGNVMPVPQRFMPTEAMDPDYLTGQRPADVLIMRSDDTKGDYCLVTQGKTGQKLRILMRTDSFAKAQKHKSPAFAGLSFESWRETRDSNPGDAINVRRFSRLPI